MSIRAILGYCCLMALLLPACHSNNKNPLPLYLAPDSPLDAPGEAAARKAIFHQRAKKGLFPVGATLAVAGGRAFFFAFNPELDHDSQGKMMEAKEVQIVTCEGLYYYVKMQNGDGGYLRETDLIDPTAMASSSLLPASSLDGEPVMVQGAEFCLPLSGEDGLLPFDTLPMAANERVVRRADGREVTLTTKQTEAGVLFKEEVAKFSTASPAPPKGEAIPDLPEPTKH